MARSECWKANNINLKHEHMSSGCFLALWSPLTASFYQVRWFVQSSGRIRVNQSFSNGTFKTRLILVLSLPYRGRTNLSAPLRALGRLTLLNSRLKCPLGKTFPHTHTAQTSMSNGYNAFPSPIPETSPSRLNAWWTKTWWERDEEQPEVVTRQK